MTGTLTDTGPLVALIDHDDSSHGACRALLDGLLPPLVTTWPCFTEAMYLLHGAEGYRGQSELWYYVASGALAFHWFSEAEVAWMRALMHQYRDRPMDLADASLVAAAETRGASQIFSVDSDFYVYRLSNGNALQVFPGPPARR